MRVCSLFLLLLFTSATVFAQGSNVLRPAIESEFVGYWRILLIPDDKLNLKIKNKETGYADPCQFFIHKPDGRWTNISLFNGAGEVETRARCPLTTKKDIDLFNFAEFQAPPRYKWRKLAAGGRSYFLVEDVQTKDRRIWVPDYVQEDVSIPNYFDLKKGDLLMNLAVPVDTKGNVVLAWRMVLRPVAE